MFHTVYSPYAATQHNILQRTCLTQPILAKSTPRQDNPTYTDVVGRSGPIWPPVSTTELQIEAPLPIADFASTLPILTPTFNSRRDDGVKGEPPRPVFDLCGTGANA